MKWIRSIAVLAVIAVLVLAADQAEAAKKKKKAATLSGTLTDVVAGKVDQEGTLILKVTAKKKKKAVAAAGEVKDTKVQVKKDTKIQKTVGKKKDKQTVDAAFSDFEIGQSVTITLRASSTDQAEKVLIGKKKKKKGAS